MILGFADHLQALRLEGQAFVSALEHARPDDAVPACPGWTVRDVARHTGGLHRKFTTVIRESRLAPPDATLESIAGGWPPDPELPQWFAQGHGALVDALATAPADLRCYTLWPAPSARDMWARRLAHETAVHRADVLTSAGEVPRYGAAFAADGIDEVVREYRARPQRRPTPPRSVVISVRPNDVDVRWSVAVGPEVYELVAPTGSADVTLSGPASDVYLRMWNRQSTASLSISGDATVLTWW